MSSPLLLLLSPEAPGAAAAIAPIRLTYRGVTLQEPGLGMYLEIVKGLDEIASVRGVDTFVPWDAGRQAGTRVLDMLAIELEGIVSGEGATGALELSSWRAKVDEFGALFDPTVFGTLEATLEDTNVQYLTARTVTHTWDQFSPMAARVNVLMESVDGDWRMVD